MRGDKNMSERLQQGKDFSVQNLIDLADFHDRRRVRKAVYLTEKLNVEILCYKPGQSTPEHTHPSQDEFFYTVKGSGTITVEGQDTEVKEGDTVYVWQDEKHTFENTSDEDWILLFVKGPGSTLSALKDK
jgi:quercetin dioxygenase-like cupin family protein